MLLPGSSVPCSHLRCGKTQVCTCVRDTGKTQLCISVPDLRSQVGLNVYSLVSWHRKGKCWDRRYWELGSLGPAESEDLATKRMAALRAKEYGIRVAEMAKNTLKPKQKQESSRVPSNRDRAIEFAKTVRAPKRSNKPPAPAPKLGDSGHRARTSVKHTAATVTAAHAITLEPRLSVNALVARHMDASKRVADIKAEVERWDLEDMELPPVQDMPKRRSPSPPRGRTKARSKSPALPKVAPLAERVPVQKKKIPEPPIMQPAQGSDAGVELADKEPAATADVVDQGDNSDGPASDTGGAHGEDPSEDGSNA